MKTTVVLETFAYGPDPARVAITRHVAGRYADNRLPLSAQPAPVTAYVVAPVPEPPVDARRMGVPTYPVVLEFVMVNVLWATPANVNFTVGLVARAYVESPALIAHTVQMPGCAASNDVPLTVHPTPDTAKVTAPAPDPPPVVRGIGVPAVPVLTTLVIVSGD